MKEVYNHNDFFIAYKSKVKKNALGKKFIKRGFVTALDYNRVIKEYYLAVSKMIIYDAMSHYNSHRMGNINILKYEPDILDEEGNLRTKMIGVDWKATKTLWEDIYKKKYNVQEFKKIKDKPLVYFRNDHSDGWKVRWNWDKRTSLVKHQNKYFFRAVRFNKRTLATAFKTISGIDYSERILSNRKKWHTIKNS